MSAIWKIDGLENKHDVTRDDTCMKKFLESLIKHAMKIKNFKNKKMIALANEEY